MTTLERLKRRLRPGEVYRRADLARWSNAVDRHLKQLVEDGTLTKLAGGLYGVPKATVFGEAPAEDGKLVTSFLRDDRFLVASPNAYNTLGVGTTQLYDKTVVYNHKRHGKFSLGGRTFDFRVKPAFQQRRPTRREQAGGPRPRQRTAAVVRDAAPAARGSQLWECAHQEVLC